MKKKISNILFALAFTFTGIMFTCNSINAKTNFGLTEGEYAIIYNLSWANKIQDITDNETGVHYWAIYDGKGSMTALAPRYDKDGNVMVE